MKTDPEWRPAPPPLPEPARRLPAWALGIILSVLLVGAWALYINMAPAPDNLPAATGAAPAGSAAATNELRVLIWRHAMDPQVLADFESETGIKIVRDDYDTNEQLLTLIDAGRFTYDAVLVSGVDLKHLVERDLLQPIPATLLTSARTLDPSVVARAGVYDPGNARSLPLLWGTLGLAYNPVKIAQQLGDGVVLDSWSALFDADTAAKLAKCGIQIVDSPRGVFPIALSHLGLPLESDKPEDIEAATRIWETIRPSIAKFSTSDVVEGLAEGRVCMALATSGDAFSARQRAVAGGAPMEIRYVLPKEGKIVWYDLIALPKSGANQTGAIKLVDFLLRPQVAARLTNATGLPSAVRDSGLYVSADLKNDPALFPETAVVATFRAEQEPSSAAAALRDRFWQLINTPPAAPPPTAAPSEQPPATPER